MEGESHKKEKTVLHPRNKHRENYDFTKLISSYPPLKPFVQLNKYENLSIDFFNPDAVKALNAALLIHFYGIEHWDFPKGYLCPAIPGRVDYIHYLADLLSENKTTPKNIKCLDIGTGANCTYPILGSTEYKWSFVGTDIDSTAVESAKKIINSNRTLKDKIEIRLQDNRKHIFRGIIKKNEFFDISICNPPFHKSEKEAQLGSQRKLQNLNSKENNILNFSGQKNELWCTGGEKMFIKNMIKESKNFASSCQWFTSLVSKKEHLNSFYDLLKKVSATQVKTIDMAQGNKKSRILAWSFM